MAGKKLTTGSQLIANVRDYILGVEALDITHVFRGWPSSNPSMPSARIHMEDRAAVLDFDTYDWATDIVVTLLSESLDELDDLEMALLDQFRKDSSDITSTLSTGSVGVYEFTVSGLREDQYVASRETEGRFFIARPVVFSTSYYRREED